MELDPQFKQLVQELGHAINDSLGESERTFRGDEPHPRRRLRPVSGA